MEGIRKLIEDCASWEVVVNRGESMKEALVLWPAEVDFAGTGDGGDEGRFAFVTEAAHSGDGEWGLEGGEWRVRSFCRRMAEE